VVLFQKGHEVVDLLRIQIEIATSLPRLDETCRCTCFLHIWHEVEEDEIHMLYFVGPIADELFRDHSGRHVAAHAQPALVSLLGDEGHQFGLHRAVDFYLYVAEVGIPIDLLTGLLRCGR